jgi:predicted hydrocarbon binding protein
MFGAALVALQSSMIERMGSTNWKNLLVEAGLPADKVYRTARFYPDTEFFQLVEVAAAKAGISKEVLMQDLGKDFGRYLIKTYSMMFFPTWKTLDVIEKAAPKVYKTIQLVDFKALKSDVTCERLSEKEVVVHYTSPRLMCSYLQGIIFAMAEYFQEKVEVSQKQCMRVGGKECEIHVKLIKK